MTADILLLTTEKCVKPCKDSSEAQFDMIFYQFLWVAFYVTFISFMHVYAH